MPHVSRKKGCPDPSLQLCASTQQLQERTHPVVVVADFDDGLVLPEIPDGGPAAGAGGCQDVLHLPVPCNAADVLQRLRHTHNSLSQPRRLTPCSFQHLLSGKSARRVPHVLGVLWLPFYTCCSVPHLKTLMFRISL